MPTTHIEQMQHLQQMMLGRPDLTYGKMKLGPHLSSAQTGQGPQRQDLKLLGKGGRELQLTGQERAFPIKFW